MKSYVWSIVAILAITAAIVGGVFWNESRTSKRLAADTEAVGLVATPTEWYDSGEEENVQGHTLTYAYSAGDQVFTRTLEQIEWYDSTSRYHVCYNPEDAEDSRLYPADHACGS
jgi:hypothetical protein